MNTIKLAAQTVKKKLKDLFWANQYTMAGLFIFLPVVFFLIFI